MSTQKPGNKFMYPATLPVPDDGDAPTGASVGVPIEGLLDRTAYLADQVDAAFDHIHDTESDITALESAVGSGETGLVARVTALDKDTSPKGRVPLIEENISGLKSYDSAYYRTVAYHQKTKDIFYVSTDTLTLLSDSQVSVTGLSGDVVTVDYCMDLYAIQTTDTGLSVDLQGVAEGVDIAGAKAHYSFSGNDLLGVLVQYPNFRISFSSYYVLPATGTYAIGLKALRDVGLTLQLHNYSLRVIHTGKRLAS